MNPENTKPYNKQVFRELHTEQGVLRINIPLSQKYFVCGFDNYDDSIFTAQGFETLDEAKSFLENLQETDDAEASWGIFDEGGFEQD